MHGTESAARLPGRSTWSLPATPFGSHGSTLPGPPARPSCLALAVRNGFSLAHNDCLCYQAAIIRSTFPAYFFTAPQHLRRTRSAACSAALPVFPVWAASTLEPVARFPRCNSSLFPDLHSPWGPFRTLLDRRVQPGSRPESALSGCAR